VDFGKRTGQKMSDYFGVGLRGEVDACFGQLRPQRGEVLDDAVMDDGDPAVLTDMRMGVVVGGTTMRGPAGVPDAGRGLRQRILSDQSFQIREFPRLLAHLEPAVADDGNTGRVVSAVFESAQARDHYFEGLLLAHIAHDPAHADKTTPEVTR
jgi:hypothetical protein